jgi:hypothetical protein
MSLKNNSLTKIFFKLRALIWIFAIAFLFFMVIWKTVSLKGKKSSLPVSICMCNPLEGDSSSSDNPFTIEMYAFDIDCLPPIIEPHPRSAEEMQREWEDEDIEEEDDRYYGKDTPEREARRQQREDGNRSRIAYSVKRFFWC